MTVTTTATATATATSGLTGSSLIGSADVHPDGGTFRGVDPATGAELDPAYGEAGPKVEKDLIQDALKSARGNRAKAARLLGEAAGLVGNLLLCLLLAQILSHL